VAPGLFATPLLRSLPEPVQAILARALAAANFTGFTEQLAIARQAVRMAWAEVFSQGDEK
jgi:glutamate-ammonia-ligase adenylyltransferase